MVRAPFPAQGVGVGRGRWGCGWGGCRGPLLKGQDGPRTQTTWASGSPGLEEPTSSFLPPACYYCMLKS